MESVAHSATAVTKTDANLFVLTKENLEAVLLQFPTEKEALYSVSLKRQQSLTQSVLSTKQRVSFIFEKLRSRTGDASKQTLTEVERSDLTFALNEQLRRVPLFQSASFDFVKALGNALIPLVFETGSHLFRVGEDADAMYFVMEGSVGLLSPSGDELMILSEGSLVGEAALLNKSERVTSAQAKSTVHTMYFFLICYFFLFFICSIPFESSFC